MLEILTVITSTATAVGTALLAYGMFRLNAKVDRFIGRVEATETTLNAHVTAPGLHR